MDVCPVKTDDFPRAQSRENLEAVGVYVFIFHDLPAVCGSIHTEQLYQVRGLQDLFAFVPRPGGYAQRFRVERGQLAQAAVFEEGPHVRAQTFERFLALAGCIGFVHNFLHVLFCQ